MRKWLWALLCCPIGFSFAQSTISFKGNAKDTLFGKVYADPYRSMEDTANAQLKAWAIAQSNNADSFFNRMPGFQLLQQQISKAITAARFEDIEGIVYANNTWIATKRLPEDMEYKVFVYPFNQPEQLLFDPNQVFASSKAKNKYITLNKMSRSGRFIDYYMIPDGNEFATKNYVYDVRKKQNNVMPFLNDKFASVICFHPVYDSILYYIDFSSYKPDSDPMTWLDSSRVYEHHIGSKIPDKVVIGYNEKGLARGVQSMPEIQLNENANWVLLFEKNMVNKELKVFACPKASFGKNAQWHQVFDFNDQVVKVSAFGDLIYALTTKDAGRYKLISVSAKEPMPKQWKTIVPEQNFVMDEMGASKNYILLSGFSDKGGRLFRVEKNSGKQKEIVLGSNGRVKLNYMSPTEDIAAIELVGYTQLATNYKLDIKTEKMTMLPVHSFKPVGNDNLIVKEVQVKSHDGVLVPMTLIHHKDLDKSKIEVVSLSAYGAYGIQDFPNYWPEDVVRYTPNYIRAIAHVRGGGVYGEEWHKAGMKTTKPNTWKDAIACANYLIEQGYATPQKLFIAGTSAGGIMAGRAITERPDLFKGAILNVGALDMLGSERSLNGSGNITEFGTIKNQKECEALYEMSTYHHIQPNVQYPAVLFDHGFNDNRVPVASSMKTFARFQEAAPNQLMLLKLNFKSGHGFQSTGEDVVKKLATQLAFYYHLVGKPEFK